MVANPPVPLDFVSSLDELAMGGDGTLYMLRVEKVEIDTGVPLFPRLQVQVLRVLVRAPGAGWARLDDIARLADRARAIQPTDEQAALQMATSRLEPVAVVRADDTRALVLWRRNGALEGALGTAAGFDAPFAIAGDSNFAFTRPEDGPTPHSSATSPPPTDSWWCSAPTAAGERPRNGSGPARSPAR